MSTIPSYITTTHQLDQFCQEFRQDCLKNPNAFMTVDTEFVRRSTYWANLALIQIASSKMVGLIDILSKDLDLSSLKALLIDPDILKVFHSSRQDCEILLQRFKVVPYPLYDTQIAAMAAGFGESVGYETLVLHYLGVKLDKSQQFTDWLFRPLNPAQIQYAVKDVVYLRQVYEKLSHQLTQQKRAHWVNEEMAISSQPNIYVTAPQDAWKRLKVRSFGKRVDPAKFTALLQKIAAWREEQAQHLNVPRNRIIKDENITDTALHLTSTSLSFKKIDDLLFKRNGFAVPTDNNSYQQLKEDLQTISKGEFKTDALIIHKKPLSPYLVPLFDLLWFFLKNRAESLGIVSKLLATSSDIEYFLTDPSRQINFLSGWRWDYFGKEAKGLKEGKRGLFFDDGIKTKNF